MQIKTMMLLLLASITSLWVPSHLFAQGDDQHLFDSKPNIILINLDDADAELLSSAQLDSFYPSIRDMCKNGMRFTNMHATTPLCGPSRAALFRGQYAFNTGIKSNNPELEISNGFSGGHGEFVARGYDQDELGVWMKNAGYRTMHVGKFHHNDFNNQVPPGWDDFRLMAGAKYFDAFRFSNEDEPQGRWSSTGEDAYVTNINTDDAVELIQQNGGSNQPFFLYIAPLAPHSANTFVPEDRVEPQYTNFAAGQKLPLSPDLYEADVSDKPHHLQFFANDRHRELHQRNYISRVRAIKSVDDMIERINAALRQVGATENTYVFLTSDNGFQLGHHHLQNKTDPYQRTSNVPLIVTGPGITGNQTADHLLAHIDLCPTILQLAQSAIPPVVEAKSFFPLLFSPFEHDEETWQDGIMIENWIRKGLYGQQAVGSYVAYRRHHEIFVSWANRTFEYYDLISDPFQLDNQYWDLPTATKQDFKRIVRRFRGRRTLPGTTLESQFRNRMQTRNVHLRGYAEDDAGVFGTIVTVKSTTTDRYWNGNEWQDPWFGHVVEARNRNQPITIWNFRTRLETETENGLDFLLFTYRSLDSDGDLPNDVKFHINPVDGKSPTAQFADFVVPPAFGEQVTLSGNYFDAVEFRQALVTIRDTQTNQYFDGTNFQNQRTDLDTELINDSEWQLRLALPAGRYVAGVRGLDAAGNLQHPADILRFSVRAVEPE